MSRPGSLWGATVGAVIVYTSAVVASMPPPLFYFPRLGVWGFQAIPDEPGIRWFGWLLYTALGGVLGYGLARSTSRRPPWAAIWLLAIAAMLLLVWREREWFLH